MIVGVGMGMGHDSRVVLIVDGVEEIHDRFNKLLRPLRCLSAHSGHQALEIVERTRVDVMLVHMSLPESRATRFLVEFSSRVPDVVCHTAFPSVVTCQEVLDLGGRHFFDRTYESCLVMPALVGWLLDTRRGRLPPPDYEEALLATLGLSCQEARLVSHVWRRFELTQAEAIIVALRVRGHSREDAARWLEQTVRTIDYHARQICDRIKTENHLDDLVYAIRQCLVPDLAAR